MNDVIVQGTTYMENIRNSKLPFSASGKIPLDLSSYNLTIEVSGKGGQEFTEDVESIITCLVDAGEGGMLRAEGVAPQDSSIELISREQIAVDKMMVVCHLQKVDLAAYRMLFNMLAQIHQLSQPWRHVHLDYFPLSRESLTIHDLLTRPVYFPSQWIEVPFRLDLEEFGSQRDMHTIRMEFGKKLENAQFDVIGAALENWAMLIMFGAYLESFDAMEDFSIAPGEIYMVDPYTVEKTIRAFRAPEIVFDAVINLATKLHFTLSSVVCLEIV